MLTIEQLDALIASNKMDKVKSILQLTIDIDLIKKAIKEYHPNKEDGNPDREGHDVFNTAKREDRPYGVANEDGSYTEQGRKPVNRIAFGIQKQIVLLRSAFIGSPKMQSNPENDLQKNFVKAIDKVWHDNKINYKFQETMKRTMSELRSAWLFYNTTDEKYWEGYDVKSPIRPKVKVLSYELGDHLYPVYDDNDDLIAFGRFFTAMEYDADANPVTVEHLHIYTSEKFYFKKKIKGEWFDNYASEDQTLILVSVGENVTVSKQNLIGKIPIIYFQQDRPEWNDIQTAADRIEESISNHADANDYNAWPILFGKGRTIDLPSVKAGKYIEGDETADLKFVNWDNLPAGIKMEIENLLDIVHGITNTVRLKDFESLGQMSGFAMTLRFLLPILAAQDKVMSTFGESVERAYNYLKTLIAFLDKRYLPAVSLQIKPEFESVLPKDEAEFMDKINKAKNGGYLSTESAIEISPTTKNVDIEKKRIQGETAEADEREIEKTKAAMKVPVNVN